ncbi:AAA family ATPase [Wukongibacter baidiensis]|uniref:AAA family ATPase n=1 Tax=Wukongibacter baidiensis TaxID=1723361 RepID=UPI003D7F3FD8
MKKLVFIHGPNGVGKSTTCELLHRKIENSAWLESEWTRRINPFTFSPEIERATEENMTTVLKNYLKLPSINTVIFNWGLHGPREKIFNKVLDNLKSVEFEYVPIIINCSEEENIKRMKEDQRSELRIERAIGIRKIYENLLHFKIDSTDMSPNEVADHIIEHLNL